MVIRGNQKRSPSEVIRGNQKWSPSERQSMVIRGAEMSADLMREAIKGHQGRSGAHQRPSERIRVLTCQLGERVSA